jgi:ankyrin repeat protein
VRSLVTKFGHDVNVADVTAGLTAAFAAAQNGHATCLLELAALGADLDKPKHDGSRPAHVVVQKNHHACVAILAAVDNSKLQRPSGRKGADLDLADRGGFVPISTYSYFPPQPPASE